MTNSLIALVTSLSLAIAPVGDNGQPCLKNCKLSPTGLALIRTFEGYSPYVYKDSAGLDTIGYGHLIVKGEKFSEPLMPEEANKLLEKDTATAVKGVNRNVKVKLKQNQADALMSFTYNVGVGALAKSSVLTKVNEEKHEEVPERLMRWIKAGGKVIQGLINRRKAEGQVYQH